MNGLECIGALRSYPDPTRPRPDVVESHSTTTESQLSSDSAGMADIVAECLQICDKLKGACQRQLLTQPAGDCGGKFETRSTMGLVLDGNTVDEVIVGGPAYVSNQVDGGDVIVEVNGLPGTGTCCRHAVLELILVDGSAEEQMLHHLLVGEDSPGTAVTIGLLKGGRIRATVTLNRMASDIVAGRCRMLEVFAKMKARTSKLKGGDLVVQYIDRAVEMWTDLMVRDGKREKQICQNFAQLQNDCSRRIASLSRNLEMLGTQVGHGEWHHSLQGSSVALDECLKLNDALVTRLKSAASEVRPLVRELDTISHDCRIIQKDYELLASYFDEQEDEIHTQRATNEILMNAFRDADSEFGSGGGRRFSVHSAESPGSPDSRRMSNYSQQVLRNPKQEAQALAERLNCLNGEGLEQEHVADLQQQIQDLEHELAQVHESLLHAGQLGIEKQGELSRANKELLRLRQELCDAGETVQKLQGANSELEQEMKALQTEVESSREFVERLEAMEESLTEFQEKAGLGQEETTNSLRTLWTELTHALHCLQRMHSAICRGPDVHGSPAETGLHHVAARIKVKEDGEHNVIVLELHGPQVGHMDEYSLSLDLSTGHVESVCTNQHIVSRLLEQALESNFSQSQNLVSAGITSEALKSSVELLQGRIRELEAQCSFDRHSPEMNEQLEQQLADAVRQREESAAQRARAEDEVVVLRREMSRLTKTIESVNARSDWALSASETRAQRLKEQEHELEASRQAVSDSLDAPIEIERQLHETKLDLATAQNEKLAWESKAQKLSKLLQAAEAQVARLSEDLDKCQREQQMQKQTILELEAECHSTREALSAQHVLESYAARGGTIHAMLEGRPQVMWDAREDDTLQTSVVTTCELELEQLRSVAGVTLSSLQLELSTCYNELTELVVDSEREESLQRHSNSEVQVLMDQVTAWEEENGQLQVTAGIHEAEINVLKAHVTALEEESSQLHRTARDHVAEIEQLTGQLTASQQEHKALQENLSRHNGHAEDLTARISETEIENEQLRSSIAQLNASFSSLTRKQQESEAEFQASADHQNQVDAKLRQMQFSLLAEKARNKSLAEQVQQLQKASQIADIAGQEHARQILNLGIQVVRLEGLAAWLGTQVGQEHELSSQLEHNASEIMQLQNQFDTLHSVLSRAATSCETWLSAERTKVTEVNRTLGGVLLAVTKMHHTVFTSSSEAVLLKLPAISESEEQDCEEHASSLCSDVCSWATRMQRRVASLEDEAVAKDCEHESTVKSLEIKLASARGQLPEMTQRCEQLEDELHAKEAASSEVHKQGQHVEATMRTVLSGLHDWCLEQVGILSSRLDIIFECCEALEEECMGRLESLQCRIEGMESERTRDLLLHGEKSDALEDARRQLKLLQHQVQHLQEAENSNRSRQQEAVAREAELSAEVEAAIQDTVKEKLRADDADSALQQARVEVNSHALRIQEAECRLAEVTGHEQHLLSAMALAKAEIVKGERLQRQATGTLTKRLGEVLDSVKELHGMISEEEVERSWGVGLHLEASEGSNVLSVAAFAPGLSSVDVPSLQPGDAILSIDAHGVETISATAAAKLLLGDYGSTLQLAVRRADTQDIISLELQRTELAVEGFLELPDMAARARSAIQESRQRLSKLRALDHENKASLAAAESRNEKLESDVKVLEGKLDAQAQQCSSAHSEIVALTTRNRELDDMCLQLKGAVESSQRERISDQQEFNQLKDEKEQIERRGSEFKWKVDEMVQEMETLKATLSEHLKRLLDTAQEKQKLERLTQELQRSSKTVSDALQGALAENKELRTAMETVTAENVMQQGGQVERLQLKKDAVERELVDLKEQNAALRNKIHELEQTGETEGGELLRSETLRSDLERQVGQLREELITLVSYTDGKHEEHRTSMARIDTTVEGTLSAVAVLQQVLDAALARTRDAGKFPPRILRLNAAAVGLRDRRTTRERGTNTEHSSASAGPAATARIEIESTPGTPSPGPGTPSPCHWLSPQKQWHSLPSSPSAPVTPLAQAAGGEPKSARSETSMNPFSWTRRERIGASRIRFQS